MNLALLLLVFAATVLGIVYRRADRETITAAEFRAHSAYTTASLEDGVTAYRDLGAKDAPVLVIIHGATLGSVAYEDYFQPFVEGGYRVVAYDEYGRGFSDRTLGPLTMDCMRRQLLGLLDHLKIETAVLYGISMGGAIAARVAAAHPERVTAIGFQVPLIRGASSPLVTIARIPLLNRFLGRVLLVPKIIERGEAVGVADAKGQRIFAHFRDQFTVEGTLRNLLSMTIGDVLGDRLQDHATIAATGIPVQFAYASDDSEIHPTLVEQAISFYDEPDVRSYTGGHFFSSGRQAELAARLLEFLAR